MSAPTHCPYCNAQLSTRRLSRESKAQCARCGTVFQADTGRILSPPADAGSRGALIGVCPSCGKDFAIKAVVANPKVRCGQCGTAFLARDHATPRTASPRPPAPEDDGARPFVLDSPPSPDAADSGTIEAIIESGGLLPPGIAPVEEPEPGRMLKESLVTFSILGALACIGALLWVIFGGAAEPLLGDYAACVPENAKAVACIDLQKIRQSSLYARFKGQAESATRQLGDEMPFDINELDSTFLAGDPDSEPIAVLRMARDLTLAELAKDSIVGEHKEHEGIPYVECQWGAEKVFLAKLDSSLYFAAPAEPFLHTVIAQRKASTRSELSERLRSLLKRVAHHDIYVAVSDLAPVLKQLPVPAIPVPSVKAVALGVSLNDEIAVDVFVSFETAEAAEGMVATVRSGLDEMIGKLSEMVELLTGRERDSADKAVAILRGIEIAQDGTRVSLRARAQTGDIEALIDMGMSDALPVGPGAPKSPPPTKRPVPPKAPAAPKTPEAPKGKVPVRVPDWS